MEKSWFCKNEEDTIALAQSLAAIAKKGDVFTLFGTLGVGKSVFSRGFIRYFCHDEEVPSPTFTLLQMYPTEKFDIYHFDLYRIKSSEEIFEIGMEEAIYGAVSLIEWPEKMGGYLPKNAFVINISTAEDGRIITLKTSDVLKKERLESLA